MKIVKFEDKYAIRRFNPFRFRYEYLDLTLKKAKLWFPKDDKFILECVRDYDTVFEKLKQLRSTTWLYRYLDFMTIPLTFIKDKNGTFWDGSTEARHQSQRLGIHGSGYQQVKQSTWGYWQHLNVYTGEIDENKT